MSYTSTLFAIENKVIRREFEKNKLLRAIGNKPQLTELEKKIYKKNYQNAYFLKLTEEENIKNLCICFRKRSKTIEKILKTIEIKLILHEEYNIMI